MAGYISQQVYIYLQNVQAYIAPPIVAVFLLGVFWVGANARGAMACLIAGFVLGMGKLVLQLMLGPLERMVVVSEGLRRTMLDAAIWYGSINFMHFTLLLFIICSLVLIVVSVATGGPASREKIEGLTYATTVREAPEGAAAALVARQRRLKWWLLVGICICLGAVWVYFSPLVF